MRAFEEGLKSDDIDLRFEAIVEMSHLQGPDFAKVGLVFEKAFLSPHQEVKEAAEALLADYPEPGRKLVRHDLLNSNHEEVRQYAQNATHYSAMISWIKELPKYTKKTNLTATCAVDCSH
jgi:hypothetical protein